MLFQLYFINSLACFQMYYHRTVWYKNVVQNVHLVWCMSMCVTQKPVTEGIRTAGSRRKVAEDVTDQRT